MIDFGKNYSSTWRVFKVNRDTWADGEIIEKVDSVSISRDANSIMLESGSMEVSGDLAQDYYRIVMTAEQDGATERVDVATLLFTVDGGTEDYGFVFSKLDGCSVLYPASTTAVTTGEYAPAGVDGAQYVAKLLGDAINAPIEIEGSFTLNNNVVHELGSSVLEAAWSVLDAGNFVLQVDGRGVVHIRPKPIEPSLVVSGNNTNLIVNGISFESNDAELPNRYIVLTDNLIATASNNNLTSRISIPNRGFTVDLVDTSPMLVNGETLNGYALRRLKESSILKETRSYTREYAPDVYPFSIVKSSINEMKGDYRVESQSITCGNGITVSEKASKEINLWE